MKEILITKDVAWAAKTGGGTISDIKEVDLLADGAMAAFVGDTGAFIATTNTAAIQAALKDKKSVMFAIGRPSGGAKLSQVIPRLGAVVEAQEYAAPVKSATTFGYNGSSGAHNIADITAVVGEEFSFRITEETGGLPERPIEYVSHTVLTGQDIENCIDAMVAEYNARPNPRMVAAKVGSGETNIGISFTAVDINRKFNVIVLPGVMDAATKTVVLPSKGSGDASYVAALEKDFAAEEGILNRIYDVANLAAYDYAAASSNYDMYSITWDKAKNVAGRVDRAVSFTSLFAFVDSTDNAAQTVFESILGVAFGADKADAESGEDTADDA